MKLHIIMSLFIICILFSACARENPDKVMPPQVPPPGTTESPDPTPPEPLDETGTPVDLTEETAMVDETSDDLDDTEVDTQVTETEDTLEDW